MQSDVNQKPPSPCIATYRVLHVQDVKHSSDQSAAHAKCYRYLEIHREVHRAQAGQHASLTSQACDSEKPQEDRDDCSPPLWHKSWKLSSSNSYHKDDVSDCIGITGTLENTFRHGN